jgi:peptide/nickel transport system substrate-binding protein
MNRAKFFYLHSILSISICFYLFLFVSCTSSDKKFDKRTVFRYNESKGVASLDPAYAKDNTVTWPVTQMFNGLIEMDDSLRIKSSIARKWSVSADGLTYTFVLRTDVYFHNHPFFPGGKGRRVSAHDFVYSFLRIVDPSVASPGISIFKPVAKPYKDYGFKALNDTVFQVTLQSPFSSFLGLLSMPYCFVVPREIVEKYGADFREHPVGTGPFMFKIWREGEKLVMVKNPRYFELDSVGNRLPYLDAVSITFIADKQSEFLEFAKGNIDFLNGINASYKDELITRSGKLNAKYVSKFVMETMPQLNTEYLTFLVDSAGFSNNPLLDKNVRLAINHGFDRARMVKYLKNNLCQPAYRGIIPKGLPGYSDEGYKFTYNPDYAANLLAKAGYPGGKGLPEITLTTTSDYLDLCEFIQHELNQIGINLKIEVSPLVTFKQNKANARLPFFRSSWIADYPDAENYLSLFYSRNFAPNGPNYAHYANAAYDQLYEKSVKEGDFYKRLDLFRQMNEMIVTDAVIVPLFYDMVVRLYPKNISGFHGNPLNILKLKFVRKI